MNVTIWLVKTFNSKISKSTYEQVFMNSCRDGNLELTQLVVEEFTDIDYHANNEEAFRQGCINGHVRLVRWLKTTFPDINHNALNNMYRQQIKNSEILEWLDRDCYNPFFHVKACVD